jgi:lysophospholipase L1-like esterase
MRRLAPLLLFSAASAFSAPSAVPPFELLEGDRVAFIGNGFFEYDLRHNHLEALLTASAPERNVSFRNLGWTGDTVWGHARAGFGSVDDGFKGLRNHVADLKPTVVFLAYGMNESFEGEAGLDNFQKGLDRLLDMIGEAKPREVVLLSPLAHENRGRPFPDPAEHNRSLAFYVDALKKTSERRGCRFVDLFRLETDKPLTENGIHLTSHGYRRAADATLQALGLPARRGNPPSYEKLRDAIRLKNDLYFHRWRPQNNTYLFLFRKHEQGKNAVEPPRFDSAVADKEKEIAALRAAAAKETGP